MLIAPDKERREKKNEGKKRLEKRMGRRFVQQNIDSFFFVF